MVYLELTDEEAQAVQIVLAKSINPIIAAGDPDKILEALESVEEKIVGAADETHRDLSKATRLAG
jgi:hypothetical protein